jgi:hypothetical protein
VPLIVTLEVETAAAVVDPDPSATALAEPAVLLSPNASDPVPAAVADGPSATAFDADAVEA